MSIASALRLGDFLPPIVARPIRRRLRAAGRIRFLGNFPDWAAAEAASEGYDAPRILAAVHRACAAVRDGRAAAERDGFLFDHVPHNFPLLAGLLKAAAAGGGRLEVLDFGGSLGGTFAACRAFLGSAIDVHWNVVEQPHFVACGREHFTTSRLRFFGTVEDCLAERPVNLLLVSGVLAYLPDPYAHLASLLARRLPWVILDRTPVVPGTADRLTVQHVPPAIYGFATSYPAWFLGRQRLLEAFSGSYRLVAEFEGLSGRIDLGDLAAQDSGFILEAAA